MKKNVIGKKLGEVRREKQLSQEELAARMREKNIGISRRAISRIEAEQRMVLDYEVRGFCEVLGIDPEELLADFWKLLDE